MAQQGASLQTYASPYLIHCDSKLDTVVSVFVSLFRDCICAWSEPILVALSSLHSPSHSRYNNELVKCLEDLREKREQVNKAILKEEKEKATIQKQVGIFPFRIDIEIHFLPRTVFKIYRLPSSSRAPLSCSQLQTLTERLHKVNEAIAQKIAARDDYDKTVRETESAYMKILESSQTLLTVLKRESVNLTKKKQSSSDGGDDE